MSISIGKIVNWKNDEVKNKNQQFPKLPEDLHLPELPFIALLIGNSGAGKTTTAHNLLKRYQSNGKVKAFDRIVLFSPTGTPDQTTGLTADPRLSNPELDITDMYDTYTDDTLEDIMEEQKDKIVEFKDFLEDTKLWNRYINDMRNEDLEADVLEMFNRRGHLPPQTDLKRFPSSLCILDDMGDDVSIKKSGKSKLNNFVCRIRHALFSFMANYQSLVQCPATIRKQCNLWIIYKTQDHKYLKKIHEECCSGDMKFTTFQKMFNMLTDRHDFIMINMKAKDINKKYRLNFDTFLDVKEIK
jgi:hypothetical protein